MKKVLSMLLAIIMLISMIPATVFAQGTPRIYFEVNGFDAMTAKKGDTFTVKAFLENNPGISAFTNTLTWNTDVLRIKSFVRTGAFFANDEDPWDMCTVGKTADGVFTGAIAASRTSGDYYGNGQMYTVTFEIIADNGSLNLGIETEDWGETVVFCFADSNGQSKNVTIDESAFSKLSFGGPEIPTNNGFTAITTDYTENPFINGIVQNGTREVNGKHIPFFIVYVPKEVDAVQITTSDKLYVAGVGEWGGVSVMIEDLLSETPNTAFASLSDYEAITVGSGEEEQVIGYRINLPLVTVIEDWNTYPPEEVEYSFVEQEDIWHCLILQDNYGTVNEPVSDPTAAVAFRYGTPPRKITVDENLVGCEIWALDQYQEEVTEAMPGDTIFLNVELDSDYELKELKVTSDGEDVDVINMPPLYFIMPEGDVEITAVCVEKGASEFAISKAAMTNGTVKALAGNEEVTKAAEGTEITLEAVAADGYELSAITVAKDGVTGDAAVVPVNNNKFTMPNCAVTISATFTQTAPAEYAINKAEITGGTVAIKVDDAEVAAAAAGTVVTLVPAPAEGNVLSAITVTKDGFTDDEAIVTVNDNQFTMPDCAVTVSAEFIPSGYAITGYTGENGTVTAGDTAIAGAEVALTVTPATGYQLKEGSLKVTKDGLTGEDAVVPVTENKFTMPAANVTITAEFEKATYSITVKIEGEGSLETAASAQMGDVIALAPNPGNEYTLSGLTVMCGEEKIVVDQDYKFNMPAGDVVVTAVFGKANKITNITIDHPILESDEQGNLSMNLVTGISENLNLNTVLGDMGLAATQTVTWTVAPADVASVDANGKLTALMAGTATVTATASDRSVLSMLSSEGPATASFTLNVSDPADGYRVSLPADDIDRMVTGQDIQVDITFGHSDSNVTTYNAYELNLSYDADKLTLATKGSNNAQTGASLDIKDEKGNVTITCIGEDKALASDKLSLTFVPEVAADTYITLNSAKVATSADALENDAVAAQVMDKVIQVKVTNYSVALPEGFFGEAVAQHGLSYTFTANNPYYDYDFTGSTMKGQTVTVTDNNNGTFTINAVSGDIVITFTRTAKTFTLGTLPAGLSKVDANAVPTYGTDFQMKVDNYDGTKNYNVTLKIGGESYNGYSFVNGVLTIHGADITGDITDITFTATDPVPEKVYITFAGDYKAHVDGKPTTVEVAKGSSYSFTINAVTGIDYLVSYKLETSNTVTNLTSTNNTYTISNVDQNITIYVNGDAHREVTGGDKEFAELGEQTLFKITVKQALAEGECLTYNGEPMLYSAAEDVWYYLVVVDDSFDMEEVENNVDVATGMNVETLPEKRTDVNGTDTVDINDAQLAYDLYNNTYNFSDVGVKKYLMADVNEDGTLGAADAAAVVADILGLDQSNNNAETGESINPDVSGADLESSET